MKDPFGSFETLTEQGKALTKPVQNQIKNQMGIVSPPTNTDGSAGLGIDPMTKEIVNQLYGVSNVDPDSPEAHQQQESEQARLEQARKLLNSRHQEVYVQPTFTHKREEATSDRLERQDQEKKEEDWMALQEKRKKEEVPRAPGKGAERNPGASG